MYDESAIELIATPLGLERYQLPAIYPPLNKHRYIASDSPEFAVHKAVFQNTLWNAQHEHQVVVKRKKLGLEMNAKRPGVTPRQKKKIAEGRTELAQQEITGAYRVLSNALVQPVKFTWEILKKYPDYSHPKPNENDLPPPPEKPSLPREPQRTDAVFQPKLDAMDKLIRAKREQKEHEALKHFETAHTQWKQVVQRAQTLYQEQVQQYKQKVQDIRESFKHKLATWEQERDRYCRDREKCVQIAELKKIGFAKKDPHAILDYFDMLLAFSNYPATFPQSYDLDFDVENKRLIVDYLLPPLEALPRLYAVAYDKDTDTFRESVLAEDKRERSYAQLLHEIPLRTLFEIFNSDSLNAVAAVQFRGYLYLQQHVDSAAAPARVLTIFAERAAFTSINLAECHPVDAFEQMGGTIQAIE